MNKELGPFRSIIYVNQTSYIGSRYVDIARFITNTNPLLVCRVLQLWPRSRTIFIRTQYRISSRDYQFSHCLIIIKNKNSLQEKSKLFFSWKTPNKKVPRHP